MVHFGANGYWHCNTGTATPGRMSINSAAALYHLLQICSYSSTLICTQVERLLDSVDAVIYLLDYTKLEKADEAEVLQRLKEINPQLIARLSQRLFFVVNKADMIDTSEGLDAEATKQYVADLITSQMQDENFQLKPDQACD